MATSEAQKWANKKYRETARLFIKTYATMEEIEELQKLINERVKFLKK